LNDALLNMVEDDLVDLAIEQIVERLVVLLASYNGDVPYFREQAEKIVRQYCVIGDGDDNGPLPFTGW